MEHTLDKLKQRLSIDQMVDDVGQFVGVGNVRETLHTAGQQVRENPMALALIGAGVAWLMMGRGSSAHASDDSWRGESDSGYGGRSGDHWQPYGGGHDKLHDGESAVTGKAKATASDLGGTLGDVPGKVRNVMGKASGGVQSSLGTVKEKAVTTVRPLTETIAAQPLLVGAAALAVGAILGSAMPRTRTEDRWLGPQRDKMWNAASQAGRDMGGRVTEAARTTYEAAADAAREEGLLPDAQTPTLAEKVGHVAEAAVDTAAAQVEPVLHGTDGKGDNGHENRAGDDARKGKRPRG